MKSGRLFRLEHDEATLGPERRAIPSIPTGYETLWVNNQRSKAIQADDEIAHDGKVYVVISKEETSDDPAMAVAFTVSYERSEAPAILVDRKQFDQIEADFEREQVHLRTMLAGFHYNARQGTLEPLNAAAEDEVNAES